MKNPLETWDHERSHEHGCGYAECGDPADEPTNQSDRSKRTQPAIARNAK